MTNREYVLEDLVNKLKYITKYIEDNKSNKVNFEEDRFICDIADSIYWGWCDDCPINKSCTNKRGEDSCFSSWWDYLNIEGYKEHENNL